MWVREITKNNSTAYRYLERYTDPLTGKYKTVSVTRNKNNVRSQKDAQLELNKIIEQRLKHYSTKSNTNTVKNAIDSKVLISKITHTYLQNIINEWAKSHSIGHVQSLVIVIRSVFKYAFKYYDLHDISVLDKIDIPKKAQTRNEFQAKRNNYLEDSEVKVTMKW